jgi:hypothetical protein
VTTGSDAAGCSARWSLIRTCQCNR